VIGIFVLIIFGIVVVDLGFNQIIYTSETTSQSIQTSKRHKNSVSGVEAEGGSALQNHLEQRLHHFGL